MMQLRPLIVLAGLLTVLLLAVALLLFSYRSESEGRLQQARQRCAEIGSLVKIMAEQPFREAPQSGNPLFARVNREAERLALSRQIEALHPSVADDGGERIDLKMRSVYLDQCVAWIYALESFQDVKIASISLKRTDVNMLDLDMTLVRTGSAQ
jgi:type II secretory pathway component PulM